ncbi:MAG: DUF4145 domain-containing protein [Chitinophagaceae bacterium]
MTQPQYYPPAFAEQSFHCPFCGVYARQIWTDAWERYNGGNVQIVEGIRFGTCTHCGKKTIWLDSDMIEPSIGGVPLPNQDLAEDIVEDYIEARDILNKSPRGAAALLRLAIQKLCKELGEKGKNINDDISGLVKKGLPKKVQQSLDYVRVIGNNAVHPGQIDLADDVDTAQNLFKLINIIADVMITQPQDIESLYNSLPTEQLKAIDKRDNKADI